jgi:regulator of replication initiation timing
MVHTIDRIIVYFTIYFLSMIALSYIIGTIKNFISMMKNKYEIAQNYLLNLENEELRERLKKLTIELNDLKKKYERAIQEADRVVQDVRDNETTEKRPPNTTS